MTDVLSRLDQVLEERRGSDSRESYVAKLHEAGLNKILEKMGEECVETILAAKDSKSAGTLEDVVYETADLWFHSMVMLSHLGASSEQVLEELERRFGLSGLDEKASREA